MLRVVAFAFAATLSTCSRQSTALPAAHHATGVVRSFGPQRAYVNIAHDDIPGYMSAMTMSFEPASPEQIASLAEKDKVVFDFREDTEGRRILIRIEKVK